MALTLHIVVDNASDTQLDRALLYLVRTQQRVVNIAAGSQLDRGINFVARVRQALPHIDIIWRQLEDTGIHTKLTVDQWWSQRIAPNLAWMQANQVILLLDNESSGNDTEIKQYVVWEVDALTRLHAAHLNGAVCRFAEGNIDDGGRGSNQYPLLKPIFNVLQPGDHVSPNEYSNSPGNSSGGVIARYKNMETVAGHQLNISIGEAGIIDKYQSGRGWQTVVTPETLVNQLLSEEVWYRNGNIDRALFVIGGYSWPSFQITDRVLELLEAYYAKNPITPKGTVTPPIPTPIPIPVPTPPDNGDINKLRASVAALATQLDSISKQLKGL